VEAGTRAENKQGPGGAWAALCIVLVLLQPVSVCGGGGGACLGQGSTARTQVKSQRMAQQEPLGVYKQSLLMSPVTACPAPPLAAPTDHGPGLRGE
jgi:hypothetical protein